jgi:hypothetical protein
MERREGFLKACGPARGRPARPRHPTPIDTMDIGILAAILMLAVWAAGTYALSPAPGWLHGLLTAGVFLLIWRIVVRGTPRPRSPGDDGRPGPGGR